MRYFCLKIKKLCPSGATSFGGTYPSRNLILNINLHTKISEERMFTKITRSQRSQFKSLGIKTYKHKVTKATYVKTADLSKKQKALAGMTIDLNKAADYLKENYPDMTPKNLDGWTEGLVDFLEEEYGLETKLHQILFPGS